MRFPKSKDTFLGWGPNSLELHKGDERLQRRRLGQPRRKGWGCDAQVWGGWGRGGAGAQDPSPDQQPKERFSTFLVGWILKLKWD